MASPLASDVAIAYRICYEFGSAATSLCLPTATHYATHYLIGNISRLYEGMLTNFLREVVDGAAVHTFAYEANSDT